LKEVQYISCFGIVQLPIEEGSREKEYKMTKLGLKELFNEIERLRKLLNNGFSVIGGTSND
jgi:hypothetical protein